MNVSAIIAALRQIGVTLRKDGDTLKLAGNTAGLTPALLAQVKNAKAELMAYLDNAADQLAYRPVPAVAPQPHYPLSAAQKRLWVLNQFEGAQEAYTIVTGWYITGLLDSPRLQAALNTLVDRHDSLRTVFIETGGEPRQYIRQQLPVEVQYDDWSAESDHAIHLEAVLQQLAGWPFDLERGPLLHARLIQLDNNTQAFLIAIHHIITDGWSMALFMKELVYYYNATGDKSIPPPAPLTVQYPACAQWLNDRINGSEGHAAQQFWKKEFPHAPESPVLPVDAAFPVTRSYEGNSNKYYIAPELYRQVQAFCKIQHLPLFSVLRAALHLLISKLTGQPHTIIGTPVAARNHADLEQQIGLFVNTLPLQARLAEEETIVDLLKRVNEHAALAFAHQDYPLDKIITDADVKRDPRRNPLFDVLLVVQNAVSATTLVTADGISFAALDSFLYPGQQTIKRKRAAQFDLSFSFDHEPGMEPGTAFFLEVGYATALFAPGTIERFVQAYLYILRQVLENPHQQLSAISITSPEEQYTILHTFNKPIGEVSEQHLYELLEPSFRNHSTATALIDEQEEWSYDRLNRAADAIASQLTAALGNEAPGRVALLIDRSAWMIAAILGIIKSGAAYVPVDIHYPASRQAYILADAQPAVLVVDEKAQQMVPPSYTGKVVGLNALINAPAVKEFTRPAGNSEDTAYLIYTSGSTGQPKGVNICHRNVIAFLKWADREFAATPYSVAYATTSYCFDLSVFEIFLPLIQGKTIRVLGSALRIPDYVKQDRNILINTVPSVVRSLLEQGMDWGDVAALNMAGEPIPKAIRQQLNHHRIEVRNLYGPSEDTTYSTVYRFDDKDYASVPIGHPVGYTQLYILDDHHRLQPIGVEGEIALSGLSVAKGYLNKPELTQSHFIDNPFIPGMPMYLTGDRGKWLPDGTVLFGGRRDEQVKIRGYRIEPGEIQFLLDQHPGIKESVVTAFAMGQEQQLAAYWVGEEALTTAVLKNWLSAQLPDWMVPAHWIRIDAIPLNANGKVDRKQLPPPASSTTETLFVAPETPLHETLLELWKTVLPVTGIGITHNFFEVGGNSLNAVRLRAAISHTLEKTISLDELFRHPTIAQQAGLLETRAAVTAAPVPLTAQQPYYPLSLAQERLWVLSGFEEAARAYHMPALFRVEGVVDKDILQAAFVEVIDRHEILRTIFIEKNNQPVQVILPAGEVSFIITTVSLPGTASTWLEEQILIPFDLQRGPLLRCSLLTTGEGQYLYFNMHHLISDGWSVLVLLGEVANAYRRISGGNMVAPPALTLQYKDFAQWQRSSYESGALQASLDYWRNIFADGITQLELPADMHRPAIKTYEGNSQTVYFPGELSFRIGELSKQANVTLFTVLMAGVNVLLKKYANQDDIVVGTALAGRTHWQLQQQIGFYVNTLPVRTRVPGKESFSSLLKRQHELLLKVFEHQDIPFEKLVTALDVKRDLSRSPLFDIMVVLQNFEQQDSLTATAITPQLSLTRAAHPVSTAKYDLTFTFEIQNSKLRLELEYNTSLYTPATIQRMTHHLQRVFEQATANPAITVKDIGLMDEAERRRWAVADQTAVGWDREATIVSLFSRAAAAFAERTALVIGNTSISYKELDHKSGQLAAQLVQHHDVKAEDRIVLHTARSEWMIIAILAVLKAGGAYVPVDPQYPASRKAYMISDSGTKLVLCDALPDETAHYDWDSIPCIDITQLVYDSEPLTVSIEPRQLAYVIYTSGTTGQPKGVLIEHRNVTRLLFNEQPLFDFTENDRWTLFHSYCFDFSVWEMYGALLFGGTLVIVPQAVAQDSTAFYDLLLQQQITVLNQTPTAFRSLVQQNAYRLASTPPAVRYLIFGGEALMPAILSAWSEALPSCRNINMYGITETTVHVTYKEITPAEIALNKSNIGLPIPTLSCFILDNDLQQVPVGVIGELCVGGAGVARGYLNQPELTAERFADDPYHSGQKLYHSGDYARMLPSGDMEYAGRRDEQVKIRGHRIETTEVAATLRRQEGIKDALVLAFKNNNDEYELTAWYIPDNTTTAINWRQVLSGQLPAYMVPTFFIPLERFPVNSNGKLDQSALPGPGSLNLRQAAFVPCRNELDQQLVTIWEEVLERSHIGIEDNFFDLGGHSLKATRVLSRINEHYGIKVDMKYFFTSPTVAQLSDYIETVQWMSNPGDVVMENDQKLIF